MTTSIDIDIVSLRAAIAETAAAITDLKRQLRRTWTRPMAAEQRALWALKDDATMLCILRAHLRGRFHLQQPPRRSSWPGMTWDPLEFHRQVAERAAARFGLRSSALEVSSDR